MKNAVKSVFGMCPILFQIEDIFGSYEHS